MPITQLIIKLLILLVFKNFPQAQVATTNGFSHIPNTALLDELVSDKLIRVAQLLELDDAAVVGVVVGGHWFRGRSDTAGDTQLALLVSTDGKLLGLWIVVLFKQVRGLCMGKAHDHIVES